MTLSGMSLNCKEVRTNRKSARETVKEAKYLYDAGSITGEMFRVVVERALAFEMTQDMEKKLMKKGRFFGS